MEGTTPAGEEFDTSALVSAIERIGAALGSTRVSAVSAATAAANVAGIFRALPPSLPTEMLALPDAHRWTPDPGDEAIDEWNSFVDELRSGRRPRITRDRG